MIANADEKRVTARAARGPRSNISQDGEGGGGEGRGLQTRIEHCGCYMNQKKSFIVEQGGGEGEDRREVLERVSETRSDLLQNCLASCSIDMAIRLSFWEKNAKTNKSVKQWGTNMVGLLVSPLRRGSPEGSPATSPLGISIFYG